MRKVVDTNFLQSDELRTYLTEPSNFAVVTDYTIAEVLQRDSAASIYQSVEILAEHPAQVIRLKSVKAACILKTKRYSRGLQRRQIDRAQTAGFGEWCRKLDAARNGDKALEKRLLEMSSGAAAHLDLMLADMDTYAANVQATAENYTEAELKILRNDEPFTPAMYDKLVDNIFDLALRFCGVSETTQVAAFDQSSKLLHFPICHMRSCPGAQMASGRRHYADQSQEISKRCYRCDHCSLCDLLRRAADR